MYRKCVFVTVTLLVAAISPGDAQVNRFYGGHRCGITTPLNSTGAYAGLSEDCVGSAGFTIRLSDSDTEFFTESRYHYAYTANIPTTLLCR
jgi:hypothetical protein